MCAGWSCSAAKNYCKELVKRGIKSSKIADYKGGLHEWCLYNRINRDAFKIYNNVNDLELDDGSIIDLLKIQPMVIIQIH